MIESTAFRVCKKDKGHMFRRKELRSGQQDANTIEKLCGAAPDHARRSTKPETDSPSAIELKMHLDAR